MSRLSRFLGFGAVSMGLRLPETRIDRFVELAHLKDLLEALCVNCVLDVGANCGQFARDLRGIGYVGRITADKGIWNFVGAIPKILSVHDDVTFLIAGEGLLEDEIRVYLEKHGLRNKVKLAGWIPHQKLPDYLTSLKLLVLPSYNEGLPNVMLEAMACGTPVLAVRVASIPDVIKDKETGFLIQDNSPAHLANAIVETLTNPELKRIAANAHTLAESEFRYENLTQTWKDIICSAKKGDV